MTAPTPAIVPDVGDVGSSGLCVHSPRALVPGSPEILVPASDRELASPALSYASPTPPPIAPMPPLSAPAPEFATSHYFPSALPEKMAFGRDLSKPIVPVILNPRYDPINWPPTSHSTLLYAELERTKAAQKKPPVSGFRNHRTRAPTPIATSRSVSRTRDAVEQIVVAQSHAPSPEMASSPIHSFSARPDLPSAPEPVNDPVSESDSNTPRHTPIDVDNPVMNYHNPPVASGIDFLENAPPTAEEQRDYGNDYPITRTIEQTTRALTLKLVSRLLRDADSGNKAESLLRGHSKPPLNTSYIASIEELSAPAVHALIPLPRPDEEGRFKHNILGSLLVNIGHSLNQ